MTTEVAMSKVGLGAVNTENEPHKQGWLGSDFRSGSELPHNVDEFTPDTFYINFPGAKLVCNPIRK
jgi:hypothetical protein